MATQSIIVYRNPLEAAMWEGLMNREVPIILICVLALIISVGLFMLYDWLSKRSHRVRLALDKFNNLVIVVILAASFIASYLILV